MPRATNRPTDLSSSLTDYRHTGAKRKNIPPAGLAAQGQVREVPKHRYEYNPHLPPVLRFDGSGASDRLPELLETARQRALTAEEAQLLEDALRNREPWLEWAGKREAKACEIDPVALHIHERVSAQAILRVAARQDLTRSLFADPEQEYREAVQFYQHDVDWANRLILGDSLSVMASLSKREDLAGKVQMVFIDPPYGIKFASNFQSQVGQRDLKDRPEDLTREPETVKAYRDTWTLGVHSYLTYLRDRLFAAKELLSETGSIFVQIGEDNVHRVRAVLDEVFGQRNFCAQIAFAKTAGATSDLLAGTHDFLLWYAKERNAVRFRPVLKLKTESDGGGEYIYRELRTGLRYSPSESGATPTADQRAFRYDNLISQSEGRAKGLGAACWFPVKVNGRSILPSATGRWKTNEQGMRRLLAAERVG